jgi:hypothetical protein
MINRRELLTGLAALAASAVTALPAVAEPAPLVLLDSAALPVAVRAESAATQWLRRWVEAHNTPCRIDAGLFISEADA